MNTFTPAIKQFVASLHLATNIGDSCQKALEISDQIVSRLNLTSVKKVYFQFKPEGVTVIQILSQSHLAIHFWPKLNFVHIDLVSCVEVEQDVFEDALRNVFSKYGVSELKLKSVKI